MNKKNLLKIIMAVFFFFFGLMIAFLLNKTQVKKETANNTTSLENTNIEKTNELNVWKENQISQDNFSLDSQAQTGDTGKFTIIESKKTTSDRTEAETGEAVNFSASLKNQGTKRKFLTHICFNHSGGVTFGCLLNVNIESGQEFPVSGSTMFSLPGNYSVWVTWSQDKTNFYQPGDSNSAKILIK